MITSSGRGQNGSDPGKFGSLPFAHCLNLSDVGVVASQVLKDATLLIEVEGTLRTAQNYRCGRELYPTFRTWDV